MPKIVNHDTQREMIAEVAWKIVSRDGVEAASVRNIAKEAGLSMGSMRHYFPSQADLYIYLMELVSSKAGKRIQAMIASTSTPTMQQLIHLTMQLLPIHNETRLEMEVWLWYNAKAVSTPALKPLNAKIYEETYLLIKLVIDALIHLKLAKKGIDPHYEMDRLYALVDGLALHCFMHPSEASEEKIASILTRHLEELCES
ncbi:TetR/AcrR family transcriptional regulator [Paenibacillus sp. 481]|uniref:TetR/AcrR family transcriptional regulator n=1 Tax=Paenibacillus sp. 481 TaxID=2835869 RepID=UPI001E3DC331|nr:TetR family transcriptional regulator C-terminal domain-containing protein [Paenibacillus sp. 481]UHA72487.1 TetR family transcriptional regulator C-terminal domain-containing protein [Paenibacillus sp. 481]